MKVFILFILIYSSSVLAQELEKTLEVMSIVEIGNILPIADKLEDRECEESDALDGEGDIIFTEDDLELTLT